MGGGQKGQHLLLQGAAVLGLVFQHIGPALLQARQESFIGLQSLKRKQNQVIKVDASPHA